MLCLACVCLGNLVYVRSPAAGRHACKYNTWYALYILRTSGRVAAHRCLSPTRPPYCIALHAPILRGSGPGPDGLSHAMRVSCDITTTPHFVKPGA